jgi:riboflavin kinase/FMN adenylyltransferase
MPMHDWDGFTAPPPACRAAVATIGNFDGVHRGHRRLVEEARRLAGELGAPAVAVTFEPHPVTLLRPEVQHLPLATLEERCRLLTRAGADEVLVIRTSRDLLNLQAEEFFRAVLRGRLEVGGLVEGENFAFGKNRRGTTQRLAAMCRECALPLRVLSPVLVGDEPVSSSRTRLALLTGNVGEARQCLGRPYVLEGVVGVGARRGRTLGFPTANLEEIETLLPGEGVYAGRARLDDQTWPAAANIGASPTFGEMNRKVEAHLVGLDGDLYGRRLRLALFERLRDTRSFASPAELQRQLQEDVRQASAICAGDVDES